MCRSCGCRAPEPNTNTASLVAVNSMGSVASSNTTMSPVFKVWPQTTAVGGGQFEFGRHRHPQLKTQHAFVVDRGAFVPHTTTGHHPLNTTLGQHALLAVFAGGVFIGRVAMHKVSERGNSGMRVPQGASELGLKPAAAPIAGQFEVSF